MILLDTIMNLTYSLCIWPIIVVTGSSQFVRLRCHVCYCRCSATLQGRGRAVYIAVGLEAEKARLPSLL
jgi:hypothetical protein